MAGTVTKETAELEVFLSTEEVCSFLESREVEGNVIDFFRRQKIDGRVLHHLSDKQLIEYGITAIGDRILLKETCGALQSNNKTTTIKTKIDSFISPIRKSGRRKELLDLLKNNQIRTDKKNTDKKSVGRPKTENRSVTLGLRVLDEELENGERISKTIKSPLGDKNQISLKIPVDTNYETLLQTVIDAFFPHGNNPVIKSKEDFLFEIVNWRNINIEKGIDCFTFQKYIDEKRIPGTPKIFLLCSANSFTDSELEHPIEFDSVKTDVPIPETADMSYENFTETTVLMPDDILPILNENSHSYGLEDIPMQFVMASPSGEILFRQREESHISEGMQQDIKLIVEKFAVDIDEKGVTDPVEILRMYQPLIVTGRQLDLVSESVSPEGETNFVMVDRFNLIETAFTEMKRLVDLRITLEVQFYGEVAQDLGGPRREFFTLVLQGIKEKYFEPLKEWMSADYEVIGKIFALSVLQNGPLPRIMGVEFTQELFNGMPSSSKIIQQLRRGLNSLGLIALTCKLPSLLHLFTPTDSKVLSFRELNQILNPVFSPEGSNIRKDESHMYSLFVKYMREAASGRRGTVTLASILKFVTGCEDEPVLGFSLKPCIHFQRDSGLFPSANTCINRLSLPLQYNQSVLEEELFEKFDYALSYAFFGMM